MEHLNIEVSHVLSAEQLEQISEQVVQTVSVAIQKARKDVDLDNDMLTSKSAVCSWLGCSPYLEELLADPNFPRGKKLSERKEIFFKSDIKEYLKQK